MINLLPPDVKQSYHYARRNTLLVRWIVAFSFALVGLAAISVGGIFYLQQAAKPYQNRVDISKASLIQQDQVGTQKKVREISDNLKLVVQVLSKEILFSKLLKQLAVIIPDNATLSDLTISQTQGALDITAATADYTAATQLQVNLADPANKIFSKADIININCTTDQTGSDTIKPKYPCKVTIRALFSADNPFLFISNNKPAKPAIKATP